MNMSLGLLAAQVNNLFENYQTCGMIVTTLNMIGTLYDKNFDKFCFIFYTKILP